ncbi:MarR family transcriptional regulator [Pelagibacteraceae bacterium]|nr:MarR family transcriptional regulator [Pelagibacteraceae bacterium]
MKELLYLKDDQIKDFIQMLYYAHRETMLDTKETLEKKFFGPAHFRALSLIDMNPGINVGELMFKLKITKQSLNRVLRELTASKMIRYEKDDSDTRKKKMFLNKEGKSFFENVYVAQKKRIFDALKSSEPDAVIKFKEILARIINGKK